MENQSATASRDASRRSVLAGAGAAAALAAAAALGPGATAALAAQAQPQATSAGVRRLFDSLFAAKNAHSPDRTMALFDPENTT